jgi:hypothetical protein
LPAALAEIADIATNGEQFWPGDAAPDVARALAAAGYAIVGGEVYCRRAVGWAAYLGEWATSISRNSDHSWGEHVADGLADALSAIARDPGAWGEPAESGENLRYFFAASAPSSQ